MTISPSAQNLGFRLSLVGFFLSALLWTLSQISGFTVVLSFGARTFVMDCIRGELSLWTARVARPSAQSLDWMTYDRHDSQTASEFVAAQRAATDASQPNRFAMGNPHATTSPTSQPLQPRAAFKMQPRLVRGPVGPLDSGRGPGPVTRPAAVPQTAQTVRNPDENRGWFFLGFGLARTTRLVNPGRPIVAGTFAWGVVLPLWLFVVLCAISPAKKVLVDFQHERTAWRLARGQCPACGRALGESVQQCGHCGVSITATSVND